jgi:FSR family fosmidomycin resistance protein-like MFS transporter
VLTVAAPGAIVGTVFSVLADFRSRRVIASGGAMGLALALVTFGVAPGFPFLVVASFVYGCAATALCDASELALVDLSGDDAPAAVSRSHLFGAVGDLLGPLALIGATVAGIGWRGAFVLCAVLVFGYAVWIALLPVPGPARDRGPERVRDGLREVVRDRRVWFCALVALLLGPLDEPFLAFLIADLERRRGLTPESATAIALAWTAGTMLALATTSRAGFRPAARDLTRYACVLAVAAAAAAVAPIAVAVAASVLVFGFATGRFFVALMTRILDLRPGQLGTVYAVISAVEFAGFVFPLGAGVIADALGIAIGLACYVLLAAVLAAVVGVQARRERAI